MTSPNSDTPPARDQIPPDNVSRMEAISLIADAVRGVRYGTVLVIIQDGVVVQIERTEKIRIR